MRGCVADLGTKRSAGYVSLTWGNNRSTINDYLIAILGGNCDWLWTRQGWPCSLGWQRRVSRESLGLPSCWIQPWGPRSPTAFVSPPYQCSVCRSSNTAPRNTLQNTKRANINCWFKFRKQTCCSGSRDVNHIWPNLSYRSPSSWHSKNLPGWERRCKDTWTSWQSHSWGKTKCRTWKFLQWMSRGHPVAVGACFSTLHTKLWSTWWGENETNDIMLWRF